MYFFWYASPKRETNGDPGFAVLRTYYMNQEGLRDAWGGLDWLLLW